MLVQIQNQSFCRLTLFTVLALVGCNPSKEDSKQITDLWSKTVEVSDSAYNSVKSLSPDDAKKEYKKLAQFEYRVLSVKPDIKAEALQIELSQLGQERWDCSSPIVRIEELMFFCKRRPESVLKFLPQTLLGRPS